MPALDPALAPVLPRTAEVTPDGHLALGGCDAVDLAKEFGTPLYVFDEEELRSSCRAYREAFASRYEKSAVAYAAKAYLGRWLAALVAEEGLGLDVVSGGELAVARSVGFPPGAGALPRQQQVGRGAARGGRGARRPRGDR